MSKLPPIAPLASGFRSSNKLNENLQAIKDSLTNTLSRDGSGPNEMLAPLDMNSQRIINLPEPVSDNDPVRLIDVSNIVYQDELIEEIRLDAEAAAEAAQEAAASVNDRAYRDVRNAYHTRTAVDAIQVDLRALLDAQPPTPIEWGALADETSVTASTSITSGSNTLVVDGAGWDSSIVGKLISIPKAKADGLTLLTTVTNWTNSTTITLADNATATLAGVTVKVTWVTDDSDALQAMIDGTLPGLGPCRIRKVYHISRPIYVRSWRALEGTVSVGQILNRTSFTGRNGMIVLWPGAKLIPLNGCRLDRLTLGGADAMINPPIPGLGAEEAQDSYRRLNAWTGTAIEGLQIDQTEPGSRDGGMDVEITDCSIIGMAKAIKLDNIARFSIKNVKIDCLSGVELSNVYDTGRILNLHIWGFWNGNYGHGGMSDVRPGIGLHLHSGVEGSLFNTALIFGMYRGIKIEGKQIAAGSRPGVYACHFVNYWVDTISSVQNSVGGVGIETTGECRLTKFVACHVDAHAVNWRMNHDNGTQGVSLLGCSSGLASRSCMQINSGSGIIDGFQMGGACSQAAVDFMKDPEVTTLGDWLLDNWLVEDLAAPLMFDLPDPALRRKVRIGRITIRNGPIFDMRNWISYVTAGMSSDQTLTGANAIVQIDDTIIDGLGEYDPNTKAYYAARTGLKRVTGSIDYSAASNALSGFEVFLKDHTGTILATLVGTVTEDNYRRVHPIAWDHFQTAVGDVLYLEAHSSGGGTIHSGQTRLVISDGTVG